MKIKYIDHRKIVIPYLTYHRGGLSLPSGDNIVRVNDSEKRSLMKKKNGRKPCFEEVREVRRKEVENNGCRE